MAGAGPAARLRARIRSAYSDLIANQTAAQKQQRQSCDGDGGQNDFQSNPGCDCVSWPGGSLR
jgi:hypothetical protein